MPTLLASAPTVKSIESCVRDFWFSDQWTVDPETLVISHPDKDVPETVRVVKKGRRYRFEALP